MLLCLKQELIQVCEDRNNKRTRTLRSRKAVVNTRVYVTAVLDIIMSVELTLALLRCHI